MIRFHVIWWLHGASWHKAHLTGRDMCVCTQPSALGSAWRTDGKESVPRCTATTVAGPGSCVGARCTRTGMLTTRWPLAAEALACLWAHPALHSPTCVLRARPLVNVTGQGHPHPCSRGSVSRSESLLHTPCTVAGGGVCNISRGTRAPFRWRWPPSICPQSCHGGDVCGAGKSGFCERPPLNQTWSHWSVVTGS